MAKKTKKILEEVINPVNDATLKDLTNEILEDQTLTAWEKKEQLKQIIKLNDLNVNQTQKINRLIENLSFTGRSLGQALIESEEMYRGMR